MEAPADQASIQRGGLSSDASHALFGLFELHGFKIEVTKTRPYKPSPKKISEIIPAPTEIGLAFNEKRIESFTLVSNSLVTKYRGAQKKTAYRQHIPLSAKCMRITDGAARCRIIIHLNLLTTNLTCLLPNVERMHHYQRGRTSITGLRFWLWKIISTKRLVVVVMSRLVVPLVSMSDSVCDRAKVN